MNRRTVHGMCPYADAAYGRHLWNAPAHTPQLPYAVNTFAQLLSSTRRGARLARLLAAEQLRA